MLNLFCRRGKIGRRLLLVKESVHHSKVTKALKRLLDTSPALDVGQHRDELKELREAWKTTTTGETYGLVQWRGAEVPDTLTPVSNVLLAEATRRVRRSARDAQ